MNVSTEGKDSEAIARDLDATRGEISDTLHALEAKLSPGPVIDRTLGKVRDTSVKLAGHVSNTVRQNRWPLIAAGVGLVWMIAADSLDLRPRSTQLARFPRLRRFARSSRFRRVARSAGLTGSDRIPTGAVTYQDERPLLTGILGVTLAVLIGYALPLGESLGEYQGGSDEPAGF